MRVGSLGDMVFETSTDIVLTPSAFSTSSSARYEDHPVQGGLPRSEFLAPELSSFDLSIHLRADMGVSPLAVAEQLARSCRAGDVLQLIIAGQNLGKVTIRNVSQDWQHLARSGVHSLDVKLQLKEYVE